MKTIVAKLADHPSMVIADDYDVDSQNKQMLVVMLSSHKKSILKFQDKCNNRPKRLSSCMLRSYLYHVKTF